MIETIIIILTVILIIPALWEAIKKEGKWKN